MSFCARAQLEDVPVAGQDDNSDDDDNNHHNYCHNDNNDHSNTNNDSSSPSLSLSLYIYIYREREREREICATSAPPEFGRKFASPLTEANINKHNKQAWYKQAT